MPLSTVPNRSEANSGRQSGTATPRTKEQPQEAVKAEKLEVQILETLTEAKPVSKASKAIKSDIIIAAPEADKAKREHRERGKVKMEVYKQYITAGGIGAFFLLALITALGQVVGVGSTYILKSWAEHNRRAGRNAETSTYLALYGAAVFLSSLLSLMVGILLSVVIIIRR